MSLDSHDSELARGTRSVGGLPRANLAVRRQARVKVSRVVEAAGVGLRKILPCQHLARIRLAQARQNRSNRQVEVQIRYTETEWNSSDVARCL